MFDALQLDLDLEFCALELDEDFEFVSLVGIS